MKLILFLIICFYSVSGATSVERKTAKLKSKSIVESIFKRTQNPKTDSTVVKTLKKIRDKNVNKLMRGSF